MIESVSHLERMGGSGEVLGRMNVMNKETSADLGEEMKQQLLRESFAFITPKMKECLPTLACPMKKP